MKRKEDERARAIYLRKKTGLSINQIAKEIKVAKSTASLWLRDIELTEEQKNNLSYRNPAQCKNMTNSFVKKCREKRVNDQNIGRSQILNNDIEYAFGCALFWAEGSKSRNNIAFCNTDPDMMKFFVSFLKKYFNVSNDNFAISMNCYLNNGLSLEDIQIYWLNLLGLPKECLRKCTIKNKYYDGKTSFKHPYGVCRIVVNSTIITQQIYGSIKEVINDSSDKWVD